MLSFRASFDADPRREQGLRLGTRRFTAIATCADGDRPTLLHLELQPSTGQRIAQKLADCLPRVLRTWLFSIFPEWNLPPRMVLKAQKIPWYDEFNLEKATYSKLRPLQGIVIPKLFGEVSYQDNRALLLSDIGGVSAGSAEGCLMDVADFGRAIGQCMAALAKYGVAQDDLKLENFHVVGDKVMAVDFEMISDVDSEHTAGVFSNCPAEQQRMWAEQNAKYVAKQYKKRQYSLWEQGEIAVDGRELDTSVDTTS